MPPDTVDFLLTQYLDGTLAPRDRLAVQWLLNNNPEAIARLNAYSKLDRLLGSINPMPPIQWQALSKRISAAISAITE